jgi:hypothetical protein
MKFAALLRKPTAWLPLAFSGAIAVMFVVAYLRHGLVRKPDEDAYAHLFQIFLALQLPFIAIFALKWLPQAPRQAALILALQFAAIVAVCSPVYFLHL